MSYPTISVVIPVYNAGPYLSEAVRSVLDQTLPPQQVIVVDDGSSDGGIEQLEQERAPVEIIRQVHQGIGAARNAGVQVAKGKFLAFLDADDLWTANKLEIQVAALTEQPSLEAVLGGVENFLSPDLDDVSRQRLAKTENEKGSLLAGSLLLHRTAFLRIGLFDTRYKLGEFIEWWARACRLNLAYAILPDLVLRRRIHGNNITRRLSGENSDYFRVLRENLAYRRDQVSRDIHRDGKP